MTVNLARANGEGDYAFLIAAHEAGHAMKAGDAQKFAKFQEAALRLAENDKELGAYASAMRELYAGEVKGLDEAALNEEASLKLAQQIVMDQHKLLQAVGQDRGLIGSFLDFVRGLKNSIAIKLTNSKKAMLDEAERTLVNLLRGEAGSVEGKRYSIREDAEGRSFVQVDTDQHLFDGMSVNEMQKKAHQIIQKRFFKTVLDVENEKAYVPAGAAKEYAFPANRRMDAQLKEAKMRAAPELDNLLAVSRYLRHASDDGRHAKATGGWDVYETVFEVGGQFFTGEVKVMNTPYGREFYDVTKIKKTSLNGNQARNTPAATSGRLTQKNARNTGPMLNESAANIRRFSQETSASSMLHNAGTTIAAEASSGYNIPQPGENTRGMDIKLPGPGGAQGKSSLTAPYRLPDGRSVREYIAQEYGKTSLPLFDKKDAAGAIKTDSVTGKPASIGGATTSLDKIVPQSGENATGRK